MLARAKRVATAIMLETSKPVAIVALPHALRAALADLAAELIELNQRLDTLERKLNGEN